MDFSFVNSETILKAGEVVVALTALALCYFIFKGSRQQGTEFSKILGNHLSHADKTQRDDIESRERLAGVISSQIEINREILIAVKNLSQKQ
jgi:hypothetical protein